MAGFITKFRIAVLLITIIGLALTLFTVKMIVRQHDNLILNDLNEIGEYEVGGFQQILTSNITVLESVKSFFQSSETVTKNEFRVFTGHLLKRYPDIKAIGWAGYVSDEQRAQFEKRITSEEKREFTFTERDSENISKKASRRVLYCPILYFEPAEKRVSMLGYDLFSDLVRAGVVKNAHKTNKLAVTPKIKLFESKDNNPGVIFALPTCVRKERANENLEPHCYPTCPGFVFAVIRFMDVFNVKQYGTKKNPVDIFVIDVSNPSKKTLLFSSSQLFDEAILHPDSALRFSKTINVADKKWQILVIPRASFLEKRSDYRSPIIAFFTGLILTIVLTLYTISLHNSSEKAHQFAQEQAESRKKLELALEKQLQYEQEIKEKELLLRQSQEVAHVGSWQLNCKTGKLTWSDETYRIFGISPEEFSGTYNEFIEMIHPEDRDKVINAYNESKKNMTHYGINHRIIRKDNANIRYVNEDGKYFCDKSGDIQAIGVVRDVTERQLAFQEKEKLQEQMKQMEKMDAIGQLAGGIAHDFNNMLGAIIGSAEVLKNQMEKNSPSLKFQQIIIKAATRAAEMTGKLLAFSRKTNVKFIKIDANDIIHDSVSILKSTIDKRIQFELNLSAENKDVIGDRTLLQNAIMNLGINASHAMPEGGQITINTSNILLDSVYCNKSSFDIKPGPYIQVDFQDTGTGISKDHLPHIFEPFFSTKEQGKGTGLGLSTIFGTIQQHHGAISVYSELDKGTRFIIQLPLQLDNKEWQVDHISDKIIPGSGHILLVDDELLVREMAQFILESLGYKVTMAENGMDALTIFRQEPTNFDLVILDMIMPVMNGRDCFYEIRKIDPDIKIIISSGFACGDDLNELKKHGLCAFIQKPYYQHTLSQILHNTLKQDV